MASKRKLVVSLDINAQVSSKDLEAFKKTFKTIQSSSLISSDNKALIKEMEADLKRIYKMIPSTSPSFIDQSSIQGAKQMQEEISKLYNKLSSFKTKELGKFKFSGEENELKKFNEELLKTEKAMDDIAAKVSEELGITKKQAGHLLGGEELSQEARNKLNKKEFESDFGMSSFSAGKLIEGGFSNPDSVVKAYDKLYASIQNVTEAKREELISSQAAGRTDDERAENIEKITAIMNNYAESTKKYNSFESTKQGLDISKNVAAYETLKDKKEELIKTTKKELSAVERVRQTRENEITSQKEQIVLTEEEKAKREALRETQKSNSDNVQKLIDRYLSFGAILAATKRLLQEAYTALSNLDKAFVEMAIVTELSTKEVWSYYDSFKAIAGISGFTTAQVASVTAEYLKQGETMKDALVLTEAASQAAQIAGIEPLESVQYLTSAVRGYRLEAEDAMLVSDKFAAVAAATATDYDGLATAMSKVAAQAYANGVEMDNLMGLLSTAMDVTQEAPENIGTAFKTIFARMTQISDYGATLEDNVDINKVEHALSLVNVALRDSEGNIRNLDDVLLETGASWGSLNSTQKAYITNTLAGTRQQTRLLAVFENYDKLLENIATSQDAAGATAAQQSKYMEGLAAAQNKVNIAWEALVSSVASSDAFIWALEQAATLLESITESLEDPVWSKVAAAVGVIFGGQAVSAGFSKLGDFIKFGENLKPLRDTLTLLSSGVRDAGELGLTGMAKSFKGLGMAASGAGLGISSVVTGIGALGIALVAGAALFNYFYESPAEKSKKLNEELTKTEGNLYNITQKQKGLSELTDEYKELSAKVVKTNEDLIRMRELLDSIAEHDTENKFDFGANETLNLTNIDLLLGDVSTKLSEADAELMDTQRKLFENYTANKKAIADDLGSAAEYLIKRNEESYAKLSDSELELAKAMVEKLAKEPAYTTVYRHKTTGEIISKEELDAAAEGQPLQGTTGKTAVENAYREVEVYDYETVDAQTEDILNKVTKAKEIMEQTDSRTIENIAAALETIYGEDFDTAAEKDPITQLIKNNRGLAITLEALNNLAPVMNTLGNSAKGWTDEQKEAVSSQIENGKVISYMSDNYEDLGLTFGDIIKLSGEMADSFNSVTTENLVSDMKNFESLGESIENINAKLESNTWGAESLENVLNLMAQYPSLSADIIKSVEEEDTINQSVKEAILQTNKESMLRNLDLAIAEAEAKIEQTKIELEAFRAASGNADAISAIQKSGQIDLSKAKTEDIIGIMAQENDAFSDSLYDQLLMAQDAYSRVAKMRADALAGKDVGSNMATVQSSFKVRKVTTDSDLQLQNQYIQAQIDAITADLEADLAAQESYVKALNISKATVEKLELGDVTGKSKTSSKSSGSANAAKDAEYYIGVLNKMYVAEQRVKAADLFMSKSDELLEYARSLEAVGGNLEDLGYGFTSSAQILEEQYSLYSTAIEQQEHLIAVSKEYQNDLLANLNPALQKTFKVIDGRIIPVSKEYGKLSAENMEIIDNFAKSFEEYTDKIDGATSASIEFKTAQNNLLNDMRDTLIEWQELIIEAITNEEQKYLDSFRKMIDANKKYLNERKKLYEDSFNAEDTESELNNIEKERLTLTEKIAALEGAHDQQSLKRKAEYTKSLEDLNKQYQELTLQYNRDAFLQRIDDQIAYQDEVFQKEEEAFNERISDAEYLEKRIKEITDEAKANALINQGLHNMTLKDLIDAGYVSQEEATQLGLDNIDDTVSSWSERDRLALQQHMIDNNQVLKDAWGVETSPNSENAQAIVKNATDSIVEYLKTNLPEASAATQAMSEKSIQHWTALTRAMGEYTEAFDGLTLTAPDSTALNKGLTTVVQNIKKAADEAELHYSRLKAASNSGGTSNVTPSGTTQKQVSYTGELITSTSRGGVFSIKGSDGSTYRYTNDTTGVKLDGVPTTVAELKKKFPNINWRGGKGFKTGGTTERTGLHWLDGTPGRPERILSPGANKEFEQMLGSLTAESRLRAESYTNAASDERLKEISQRLQQLSEVIVDSDEASTSKLARGLQKVAEVIEDTNTTSGSRILSTLTVNKKF